MSDPRMSRVCAQPSADTFSIPPVASLLARYLAGLDVVVDPFARNSTHGTLRNDLNPDTSAEYHMDAVEFCDKLLADGVQADAVLFDPPYSPRQIAEVYQHVGRPVTTEDTQNGRLYRRVRRRLGEMLKQGWIAFSCGWNSVGFGCEYALEELMLVSHGGAHNDTIAIVERKQQGHLFERLRS